MRLLLSALAPGLPVSCCCCQMALSLGLFLVQWPVREMESELPRVGFSRCRRGGGLISRRGVSRLRGRKKGYWSQD